MTTLAQRQYFLEIATEAACAGGAVLRSYFGKLQEVAEKQPGDLVTIADKESEQVVLDIIKRHFPDHGILAEESGNVGIAESEFLWAIDPLDGTTNFAHQYPFFAVSIALLVNGVPEVGVVYAPFFDELFRAATGLGATCNRQPMHTSSITELRKSLLVTGFAYDRTRVIDNNYAEFCHFTHLTQGVRRGGSAAMDLAYVACGRIDGYWERGLSIWDLAAGVVLVREAGGMVTAYDGTAVDLPSGRLLATNTHLHQAISDELAHVKPLTEEFPMGRV
ncbi:MAG: inositol monophosphatase family protein [Pseudanabaenaceae cyanobacterium]|jgi:myo-inositol-1(or 4)-monophosphatase